MKIHLTAFGQYLTGTKDWPEDLGNEVRISLDMDSRHWIGERNENFNILNNKPIHKIGTFVWNGTSKFIDGHFHRTYVLVDVS